MQPNPARPNEERDMSSSRITIEVIGKTLDRESSFRRAKTTGATTRREVIAVEAAQTCAG